MLNESHMPSKCLRNGIPSNRDKAVLHCRIRTFIEPSDSCFSCRCPSTSKTELSFILSCCSFLFCFLTDSLLERCYHSMTKKWLWRTVVNFEQGNPSMKVFWYPVGNQTISITMSNILQWWILQGSWETKNYLALSMANA